MNIISLINNTNENFITLRHYDVGDAILPHIIKSILVKREDIVNYFNNRGHFSIQCLDDYYDYLFLRYMEGHRDSMKFIADDYKNDMLSLLNLLDDIYKSIHVNNLISFISLNYEELFSSNDKHINLGVKSSSLDIIIEFGKGLLKTGIFEYLVEKEPILVIDNLDRLSSLILKSDKNLLRKLFIESFSTFTNLDYRLDDYCQLAIKFSKAKKYELTEEIGNTLYEYFMFNYKNRNKEIYHLHMISEKIHETLFKIKHHHVHNMKKLGKNIKIEAEKYLIENRQERLFECSSEAYSKNMDKLEELRVGDFTKYANISHSIEQENKLWESKIDLYSSYYKGGFSDLIGSMTKTNSYFTYRKTHYIQEKIREESMSIFYWFENSSRKSKFSYFLIMVIDSIYEMIGNNDFRNINENDVYYFIEAMSNVKDNHKSEHLNHMTAFYFISFLEKFFREVYVSIDENAFFNDSHLTMGTFLGNNEYTPQLFESLLGKDHLRWLRYFILSDEKGIGHDYRNRIAHLHEINIGDITFPDVVVLYWLIVSSINCVCFNLINKDIVVNSHFTSANTTISDIPFDDEHE